MCVLELISSGYELTKYLINRVVIQEKGILLGGCLPLKNLWGLLIGDDGVGLNFTFYDFSFEKGWL